MKLLVAALLLMATPTIGHADKKQQDWAACLIGQSALALLDVADGKKTDDEASDAAQEIAYTKCKKPAGLNEQELESLGDFVNATVLSIADRRVFCPEK